MDDQQFLDRVKEKIERLTGRDVEFQVDHEDPSRLMVELEAPAPRVTVGSNLFQYPGFARMAVEYAVASIRQGREVPPIEFHALLSRN